MMGGWIIIQKFWRSGLRLTPSTGTEGSSSNGFVRRTSKMAKNACVMANTAMAYGRSSRSQVGLRHTTAAVAMASIHSHNSCEPSSPAQKAAKT